MTGNFKDFADDYLIGGGDALPPAHRSPSAPLVANPTYYHVLLAAIQLPSPVSTSERAVYVPQPVTINSNRPKPRTYDEMTAICQEASDHFAIPLAALVYVASTCLEGESYVDLEAAPETSAPRLFLPENNNVIVLPGQPEKL